MRFDPVVEIFLPMNVLPFGFAVRTLRRSRLLFVVAAACFLEAAAAPGAQPAAIHLAQGALVGESTPTSAILQTRLTAMPGLANGDVAGAPGVARFEVATSDSFADSQLTEWGTAAPDRDYIVKARVTGLQPGTPYSYRVIYGPDRARATQRSDIGRFKTLPAPEAAAPVSFVLTSCLNYAFFREGTKGTPAYQGEDRDLGYPGLEAIIRVAPDFCIFDGDCVYYDHPVATRAQTQAELRKKWHEQYVMPRFVRLFAQTSTYWLKDDHDYRKNDGDTTGDYAPSHALGIATFREQVPILPPDSTAPTYRTHRIGRDLQLWFVEGRDYRTPNKMPDGPQKSIWGTEQRAWLQRTLKASDATFKILVSPTPLIGPDDAYKKDNHVNPDGFRHEGESFLAWLKASGIAPGRFYIICGDRHWKYHSQHPIGYEEFSCGALNRENSRLGRAPGDPKSTDPDSRVRQFYTDQPASGGFLHITIHPPSTGEGARIEFTQRSDAGAPLYRHAPRNASR
jgi:alkaline phosphatase/alkaline phosphatase D